MQSDTLISCSAFRIELPLRCTAPREHGTFGPRGVVGARAPTRSNAPNGTTSGIPS